VGGVGNPPEPRFPKGPAAEAAPTLAPPAQMGPRAGAGAEQARHPRCPPAARVGVGTRSPHCRGGSDLPLPGQRRPFGALLPGLRPRAPLLSDLPAAKCVTSAGRSGDTCCRPRRAASGALESRPWPGHRAGQGRTRLGPASGPGTQGSGVGVLCSGPEPGARRSRGRAGPQCAPSPRQWGPSLPPTPPHPRVPGFGGLRTSDHPARPRPGSYLPISS
jgi:hypothetical protein